jgi:hypothetical protein
MTRALVVVVALAAACGDTTAGKLCQPGDPDVCGEGFQCLTFCDAVGGPQSVCTPSFGAEVTTSFPDEALIDDKVSFGQLGNARRFEKNLRIEITGVKGVALPRVEEVVENLSVVATDVECLSLPRLVAVGGTLTIDLNGSLLRAELGSLQTAGGIVVTDNGALPRLLLTSATSVAGDVIVERNAALSLVNLESVRTVGGDLRASGPVLRRVDLDVLAAVDGCVDVELAAGNCATPPELDGVACCEGALRKADCAACR